MFREYRILKHHGKQYIPDLLKVKLNPLFRGRPEFRDFLNEDEKEVLYELCPVNAFVQKPFALDLGKCIFCKECVFRFPNKIRFTTDYKIATNDLNNLIINDDTEKITFNESLIRKEVRQLFSGSLKLRQISAGGDNSNEMELNAVGNVNFDFGRYGIEFVASPRHSDGIVITGPITENMAEALQICYEAVPEPKIIIVAGTDAISGGIFRDSPAIDRKFLNKYPVDLYVPGNPVHPLTFIHGVLSLLGKI